MPFTISTARVRYAADDAPVLLHDPPHLGYLVRVDLARERVDARLAFPKDPTGPDVGGLTPAPVPTPGEPCFQDFLLSLPPAPAEAVEAWLMGVLAPLVETIRTGTLWAGPLNLHAADPLERLVAGFTPQGSDALTALSEAQGAAWEQGLDAAVAVAGLHLVPRPRQ